MRIRSACCSLSLLVSAAAGAQSPLAGASAPRPRPAQLPADSMALGRKYAQWLYVAQVDSLMAHMDSASRAQPGLAAGILNGSAQLAANAGTEQKVLDETFITRNGNRQYWRKAQFSNAAEPFVVRIVINARGEMMGMGLNPASQTPPIDP